MSDIIQNQFGKLTELNVRDAWQFEVYQFTPWLAANLEYLSEVLSIPLELIKREAPVGPFSADLLLRNSSDESLVLVENQLEVSDHTHLGQILTYLQGLDAKTVVWIAPRFKDEHLSAIRWLNDNTLSEFAFFAVQIKAVRIGDSAIAPVFEVLERPNEWERTIHRVTQSELTEDGILRREFWKHYIAKYPTEETYGSANAALSRWHTLQLCQLIVGQFVSSTRIGVYVRGLRNANSQDVYERLNKHFETLEHRTNQKLRPQTEGRFLLAELRIDLTDRTKWDELSQWLFEITAQYKQALQELFSTESDAPKSIPQELSNTSD
jgi:hypothetical protein